MDNSGTEQEMEKDIKKTIEKKINESFDAGPPKRTGRFKSLKIFGEIVGYGIALFLIFVILPRLPFVTEEYAQYVPIAFWASTISFIFRMLKHSAESKALSKTWEIGDHLPTLYSTYMLLKIYPLDFSAVGYPSVNEYFRYFLYFALAVIMVAILASFIQIFTSDRRQG